MRIKPNIDGVIAVARTCAALLLGNSVVVPVLTNGENRYWPILFLIGVTIFALVGFKFEKEVTK